MSTAPGLTRTRSVLEFDRNESILTTQVDKPGDPGRVVFRRETHRPKVHLSMETWEDLGAPESITIAIWPGDRQDLMEQEDFPE